MAIVADLSGNSPKIGLDRNLAAVQSALGAGGGIYNLKTSNTRKLRAGLARVRAGIAGTDDCVIACIGDSKTAGAQAQGAGGGGYAGNYPLTWPVQLAKLLAASGMPADWNSWFCDHNVNAVSSLAAYDVRWVLGAGWLTGGAYWSCGPGYCLTNRTTTNVAALTPTVAFDGIELYYITGGGFGTFKIDVDGGSALGTYNTWTSEGVTKVTITGLANTTHTINFTPTSLGNGIFIYGLRILNSTAPKVDVINLGSAGTTSTVWVSSSRPWEGVGPLSNGVLAPACTFIDLQINDALLLTGASTYQTQMQTIITAAKVSGDVVLINTYPGNTGAGGIYVNADGAGFTPYQDAIRTLAAANDVPLIDLKERWTSYAASQPLGYYGDTTVHGSALGYADVARVAGNLLMAA